MLDYFTAKGTESWEDRRVHGLILKNVRRTKGGWDLRVGLELVQGIVREETRAIKIDDSLSTATPLFLNSFPSPRITCCTPFRHSQSEVSQGRSRVQDLREEIQLTE